MISVILGFVGKNIFSILSLLISAIGLLVSVFALHQSNSSHVREKETDYLSDLRDEITNLMNQNVSNSSDSFKLYIRLNSCLRSIIAFDGSSLSKAGNGNVTLPENVRLALKNALETLEAFTKKSVVLNHNSLLEQSKQLERMASKLIQNKTVTHDELTGFIKEANNLLTESNNCVVKEYEDNKLTIEKLQEKIDTKKKEYGIKRLYDKHHE